MILEPSAPLPLTSKTMKMMTVPCLYNGFTGVFNASTMVFGAFTMAVCTVRFVCDAGSLNGGW